MTRKCFLTFIMFALFAGIMFASAYVAAYVMVALHSERWWMPAVIGLGVFVISSIINIMAQDENTFVCVFTYIATAVGWGAACAYLVYPEADILVSRYSTYLIALGIEAGWFLLYCLFANTEFASEHYVGCTALWSIVLIGGAIAASILVSGWMTAALALPGILFLIGMCADAEDGPEHARHLTLMPAIIALLVITLLLHLFNSSGKLELFEFDPDEPYDYDS